MPDKKKKPPAVTIQVDGSTVTVDPKHVKKILNAKKTKDQE